MALAEWTVEQQFKDECEGNEPSIVNNEEGTGCASTRHGEMGPRPPTSMEYSNSGTVPATPIGSHWTAIGQPHWTATNQSWWFNKHQIMKHPYGVRADKLGACSPLAREQYLHPEDWADCSWTARGNSFYQSLMPNSSHWQSMSLSQKLQMMDKCEYECTVHPERAYTREEWKARHRYCGQPVGSMNNIRQRRTKLVTTLCRYCHRSFIFDTETVKRHRQRYHPEMSKDDLPSIPHPGSEDAEYNIR